MAFQVIGLMSGTSLDGLDIAFCEFDKNENHTWNFTLLCAETIAYNQTWKQKLGNLENASALDYVTANVQLGTFFGEEVLKFVQKHNIKPNFVASHGHTIFHQPALGLTTQIGSGAAVAAVCRLPVVCDFRALDVALGGQGAPLVPIGDKLLFSDYDCCINLGGIANLSFDQNGRRIAYDCGMANTPLNLLAKRLGMEYDKNGGIARSGQLNIPLFETLNELNYFHLTYPKSLGKEWFVENMLPLIEKSTLSTADLLATLTHHVAFQAARSVAAMNKTNPKILATGGGAFNSFLITLLEKYSKCKIIVPDSNIVAFKEAIVFAFLGVLRWRSSPNCLQSVTGASEDNCGGAIYFMN